MMEHAAALSLPASPCKNCGQSVTGAFCAACGQRHRDADLRLWPFLAHLLRDFFHWDSRFLSSLWLLVSRPGLLTREWLIGRERSYLRPLQLFLFVNVLYFILQHLWSFSSLTAPLNAQYNYQNYSGMIRPIVDKRIEEMHIKGEAPSETWARFEIAYDQTSTDQAKTLVILMVPMFAGLMSVLYVRQKHYYVEHLVFSLHFFAFFLLITSIGVKLLQIVTLQVCKIFYIDPNSVDWDVWLFIGPGIFFFLYIVLGLKRVYGGKLLPRLLRSFALFWSVLYIIWIYRFILFFTTMYTMSI